MELLREFAAAEPKGAPRRIELRFLTSPVAIHGDGKVESIEVQRNRIERDDSGALRARPADEATETIECDLVLRSVGYRAVPLPDVPFDERNYVLPNEHGRVVDADSREPVPGVYAVGWIKRGPTGILGTNKRDANETVGLLLEDLDSLPAPEAPGAEAIDALLAEKAPDLVTVEGWRAIDALERERGRGRGAPAGQAGRRATRCWTPPARAT